MLFSVVMSCSVEEHNELSERVKISLREVGNQLLLSNQDSTSLILPITSPEPLKYRLTFQKELSFEPNHLVSIVKTNFKKSILPEHYRVEVIQCVDYEVAYSYEMSIDEESTIIPCLSRSLPKGCYMVEVRFIREEVPNFTNQMILIVAILCCLMVLGSVIYKRRQASMDNSVTENAIKIGSFQFYAGQNKLIKEAVEINLSKKECELLEIFVSKPNEVIKRDELTKRVWEDNGVFVGRSLDTYISKLRKKLKDDESIKLTNVHGVGYKLELKY